MVTVTIGDKKYEVHEDVYQWMKEHRDIREKAKLVREAQNAYFRSKTKATLDRSKALERALDNLLSGKTPEKIAREQELFR